MKSVSFSSQMRSGASIYKPSKKSNQSAGGAGVGHIGGELRAARHGCTPSQKLPLFIYLGFKHLFGFNPLPASRIQVAETTGKVNGGRFWGGGSGLGASRVGAGASMQLIPWPSAGTITLHVPPCPQPHPSGTLQDGWAAPVQLLIKFPLHRCRSR